MFGLSIFKSGVPITHSIIIKSDVDFNQVLADIKSTISADYDFQEFIPDGDLLSIENVRELQAITTVKQNKKIIFIIKATKFPVITQNALLKLLEDGAHNITLVFVVGTSEVLLPTVISRVLVVNYDTIASQKTAEDFIQLSTSDRLKLWESDYSRQQLSSLSNELIQWASIYNPSMLHRLLITRAGWQTGALIDRYYFEYLALQNFKNHVTTQ